jgi:hypothetical protein
MLMAEYREAIKAICSWQELLPGSMVPHVEDVMVDFKVDDSYTSLVLYEATQNSVIEDEYEERIVFGKRMEMSKWH